MSCLSLFFSFYFVTLFTRTSWNPSLSLTFCISLFTPLPPPFSLTHEHTHSGTHSHVTINLEDITLTYTYFLEINPNPNNCLLNPNPYRNCKPSVHPKINYLLQGYSQFIPKMWLCNQIYVPTTLVIHVHTHTPSVCMSSLTQPMRHDSTCDQRSAMVSHKQM